MFYLVDSKTGNAEGMLKNKPRNIPQVNGFIGNGRRCHPRKGSDTRERTTGRGSTLFEARERIKDITTAAGVFCKTVGHLYCPESERHPPLRHKANELSPNEKKVSDESAGGRISRAVEAKD